MCIRWLALYHCPIWSASATASTTNRNAHSANDSRLYQYSHLFTARTSWCSCDAWWATRCVFVGAKLCGVRVAEQMRLPWSRYPSSSRSSSDSTFLISWLRMAMLAGSFCSLICAAFSVCVCVSVCAFKLLIYKSKHTPPHRIRTTYQRTTRLFDRFVIESARGQLRCGE